ncbi:MAG TPA: hypothetical protein VI461_08495, partial [Chitinophagaceae bacterium]|nr:hypothetical protein [Chitinophagaceae bacterium]
TDKSTFIAGDTIWFKAYLFNAGYPGSAGTDFYMDLLSEDGATVHSKKLPVIDGTAYGNFSLPDSLIHGFYFLRAYTRMLVAQGNKDGIIKPVAVINPDKIPDSYRRDHLPDYRVDFFHESGSFIKNFLNSIIFRATDQYGNNSRVSGILFGSSGDTLTSFKETGDGIGIFSFTPQNDEKYFAEFIFKAGSRKKYDLPVPASEGILLRVAENSKGKIFQVQKTDGMNVKGNLNLMGFMFNRVVFQEPLNFNGNTANGLIPVNNLPEGILNLAVTDNNKKVYARRPVFIYRPDIIVPLSLKTDTLSFLSRAKNSFTLTLPDSVEGNFSVSVTAYDERQDIFSNNTITTSLFWDAEKEIPLSLKSKEINNADRQARAFNDLVLITERQKSLQEITEAGETKENYIEISGDVFKEGTTKPVTEGELVFLVHTKDSAAAFMRAPVQKDGTFTLNNLVFDDMARFNYRMAGKKAPLVEIKIKDPGEKFSIKNKTPSISFLPVDRMIIRDPSILSEWSEQKKSLVNAAQGKMLSEVVVTSRIKKPVDIVNKKYSSGLFSSMNASVFDFVNEPPKPGSQRILDWLVGRVAGLTIERRGGTYRLTSTRAMSITGGPIPVQIFLNEMPVEPDGLLSLTVSEIALVKYFKAGSNMMAGFGLGGRLVIYSKAPEDINFDDVSNSKAFLYRGYNAVQEFTHIDYSDKSATQKDNRTTLYWNPEAAIFSDEKEFKVQFYNSDNAKKFKVV